MVKHTRISPISKKRAKEKLTYKKLFTEMDKEAKAKGEYVCFFCGKPIIGIANHHHLRGRENSMLNEPQYLVLAHNDCHLMYHSMTVERLKQMPWFDAWMARLALKDPDSYRAEMRKHDKAQPISVQKRNLTLFDDN